MAEDDGGFIGVSRILYFYYILRISPTFGRGMILVDDLYLVSKFHIILACISGISSNIWPKYPGSYIPNIHRIHTPSVVTRYIFQLTREIKQNWILGPVYFRYK